MKSTKEKCIVTAICVFLTLCLVVVGVLLWNEEKIFEATGLYGAFMVGEFFNGLSDVFGNRMSAVVTFILAALPLIVAINHWKEKN